MFVECAPNFRLGTAALLAALVCMGCGTKSAEERVSDELKRSGKEKTAVYPLSGHVTIDGQPPSAVAKGRSKLIVSLYDVAKPDQAPGARPYMIVDPDGSFRFSTYGNGDGLPAANYVFTFAQLTYKKKDGYLGPDALKNLYNDPDKNATKPDFKIDHKSPGRTDYSFDLKTAGEETASAGPKAVTKILTD
jgi:hypothetical protein